MVIAPLAVGLVEPEIEKEGFAFGHFIQCRVKHVRHLGQMFALGARTGYKMVEPPLEMFSTNAHFLQFVHDMGRVFPFTLQMLVPTINPHPIPLGAQRVGEQQRTRPCRLCEARRRQRYGRPSGENRDPRGRALRRGRVGPIKTHTLRGERVEVRRQIQPLTVGVAIGTDVRHAVIVRKHQQDVGPLGERRRRKQNETDRPEDHAPPFRFFFAFFAASRLALASAKSSPEHSVNQAFQSASIFAASSGRWKARFTVSVRSLERS